MFDTSTILLHHFMIALFSTGLSVLLWIIHRHRIYKILTFLWVATLIAALAQRTLIGNDWIIILGFSTCIGISFALYSLLLDQGVHKKIRFIYFSLFLGSLGLSTLFYLLELSFFIQAIPVSVTVSLPLLDALYQQLQKKSSELLETGIQWTSACLVIGFLGFPFIKPDPLLSTLGYQAGFFVILSLSIFTSARALVRTEEEKISLSIHRDQLKELSYFITHEIKNALYSIKGCAAVIEKKIPSDKKEIHEALSHITNSSARLYDVSKKYKVMNKGLEKKLRHFQKYP